MRNWWTTVGAVALCAAMAPQAGAATPHARSHAAQPSKSSLRGHQKAEDEADSKSTRGKKPSAKEEAAADKACKAAKTKAQKAKACKKTEDDNKPAARQSAAEKACAAAKTKAQKAKLCKKVDEDEDRPSKASSRRGAKDEATETVVTTASLPDARGKVSEIAPPPEKVGKGDTLYAVSRRTGVPVDELAELNKLKKPYHVRAGQSLKLPKSRAYTVHSGDTLSGVAARFGVDTDVLAAFNSFSAKTPIRAGQKLDLPPNADDKAAKIKPKPTPPAQPKPKPPAPRPAPPVSRPVVPQYTQPPVLQQEEEAPPPAASTPAPQPSAPAPAPAQTQPSTPAPTQPSPSVTRPPDQSGTYPGATALPPARPAQPAAQPPAPRPQPVRPTLEPERPRGTPPQPESQSGFQMIPAPTPQQPNPRPTYGQRPTPQQTPPPAQRYTPPPGRIIQSNPAPSQSQVTAAGRGKFIWPVRGNVLSPYGLKANGTKNDGMNIQVQTGEPVRAAASGEVVYAGDQVPSFGNLVLIKHPGGWVTAYANLGRITVQNRDQVSQGQQIGVAGQTGAVDSPQLHFEVRYAASPQDKALPVDPSLVLPER